MSAAPEPDRLPNAPHPRETLRLFGQSAPERGVLQSWSGGRLHHAWLLRGPRGVGKASFAYRLARAVLAHGDAAPPTLDAPEGHPVAARVSAGSEPRLHVARRPLDQKGDKLRAEITVDVIRGLRDFLHLSAADGGWRVAIIDAADEMNRAAQNALLKLLEEPPDRALMLLVAHAPGRLLPTIRSRCRALDIPPLGEADMADALKGAGAEASLASALGGLAGGAPGEALRLAAQDGAGLYASMTGLLAGAPGFDRVALHRLAAHAEGRDAAETYALMLELTVLAARRLALAGAGRPPAPAAPREADMQARLSPDARRARLWAATAETLQARADRALEVNLDPVETIIDMWLFIDGVAAEAA